jgi:putative transposase
LVSFFQEAFGLSRRRACALAQISRSVVEYRSKRADDTPLRERILAWARERTRYGYRRIHTLLRREGWAVNRKRVYRIYREEALSVRRRKRKQVAASPRQAMPVPARANERWSIDFMADTLADGRTFRTLNVVDDFTREALATEVGRSIPGERVVRALERVSKARGLPRAIVLDNGPEFTSRVLDQWAYRCQVELRLIQPGKPV